MQLSYTTIFLNQTKKGDTHIDVIDFEYDVKSTHNLDVWQLRVLITYCKKTFLHRFFKNIVKT